METMGWLIDEPPDELCFEDAVDDFRRVVANAALPLSAKQDAWNRLVCTAARLNPHGVGFVRAGALMKEALCMWLDVRAAR